MTVQVINVAFGLPLGSSLTLLHHHITNQPIWKHDISNSNDVFPQLHQSPPGSMQHFCEGWEQMCRCVLFLSISLKYGLRAVTFLSYYYAIMYDVKVFSPSPKKSKASKICLCFSSKRYFFSIFELKYLFGSARVWKHMNKIWKHQIACLFVPAVVHNHLSSSSFCVFRIGGVLVFVKDQGLSRVFGFPSFGCFWVSSFDVFEFPSWKVIVLVFWLWTAWGPVLRFGAFPLLLLCVSGRFPSFLCSSPLFHTHHSKIYTHTHYTLTVLSLRTPLNNIHTYTQIAAVLFIN